MVIFRTVNGLHTWNTPEHTSNTSNILPMLPPRSTISLDKDHGNIFINIVFFFY